MTGLKSALLGTSMIVCAGAFAAVHAADINQGGGLKDEPTYMPAITWTGLYLGAHVGGSFGDDFDFNNFGVRETLDIGNAPLAGFQIGYNWQAGNNLILGVEGDYTFSGGDDLGGVLATEATASIRGRLGYAFGATMVYATGGVAFLDWSDAFEAESRFDGSVVGWVIGAGVERKISSNVSLGLEGLYYAFDDEQELPVEALVEETGTRAYDRDFWAVRARLNYHFTGGHDEALK